MVLSRCRDIGEFCKLSLSYHSSIHVEFRPPKHPKLEEEMKTWLSYISERGETITDAKIQQKALEIAEDLKNTYGSIGSGKGKEKDENFKASAGWIENFKRRLDIKGGTWHGRLKASEPEIVGVPMAPQEPGTVQLATVSEEHYIQPEMEQVMEIEGHPDDFEMVEELPRGIPTKEQAERAYCTLVHYLDSNVQDLEPVGYTADDRRALHEVFLKVFFKTSATIPRS